MDATEQPPIQDSSDACANCGAAMHGSYCAACGQRDDPLRQPIGKFLKEAFVEFFGLDGRLWISLKLLLFKPGRLTNAYLAGQRIRYIRPLRFYITASVLFFILLSIIDPAANFNIGDEGAAPDSTLEVEAFRQSLSNKINTNNGLVEKQLALVDSLESKYEVDSLAFLAHPTPLPDSLARVKRALDNLQEKRNEERGDLARMQRRVQRAYQRFTWLEDQVAGAPGDSIIHPADLETAADLIFEEAPGDNVQVNLPEWWPESEAVQQMQTARTNEELRFAFTAFFRDTVSRLPTVMFVLLPIFAGLLKLFYIRREWFYSEHLVFGLHTHAFAFLAFTLMLLFDWLTDGATWADILNGVLVVIIPVYFYIAQKRVYKQGWIKTALKAWALSFVYTLVLTIGLALALLLAASF